MPVAAYEFGRLTGATIALSLGYGGLAAVAVYLSAQAPTTEDKAADLGRGVLVSVVLAITLVWVQHAGQVRSARDALALTLSSGHSFAGIDLHGRQMERFYIAHKDLTGAHLDGSDLSHAVLRRSILIRADLHDADLDSADLEGAFLSGPDTNLSSANLHQAKLIEAHMQGSSLSEADLSGADLSGADLRGADLRGANLRNALLLGADLRQALLTRADVRGAIFAADLRNAQLDGAGFSGIREDGTTKWGPAGQPPQSTPRPMQPAVPPDARSDVVTEILDGDTLNLRDLGPVRLLGINAPAVLTPPAECWGPQATIDLKKLVGGQHVRYVSANSDKFGRHLAYLWLSNGDLLNQQLLEHGDAKIQNAGKPYAEQLVDGAVYAANLAGGRGAGLWRACGGG